MSRGGRAAGLGCFALLALCYAFAPIGPGAQAVIFVAAVATVVVIGWLGTLRDPGPGRIALMAGTTCWLIGDTVYGLIPHDAATLPQLFHLPFILGYVGLGLGILRVSAPARRRRELPALLDAALVGAAFLAPVLAFLIPWPHLHSADARVITVITAGYPVADVVLLVLLLGLGATGRRHGSATGVLLVALTLWTAVDVLWAVGVLKHDAMLPARWQTGIRMLGYLCLAVGATLPGPTWSTLNPQHELGGDRRLLLPTAIGLILPGMTLLLDGLDGSVNWLQLGIVALIVSTLTVLRFDGLLAHVRHQARAFDRLARLDPLTGIANRRQWDEALAGLCAQADAVHQGLADGTDVDGPDDPRGRLCLAVLDLDHFKEFNDAHGHAEGDRLLCETVQAWTGLLADTDLLARVGGEEFAVLMPGRDLVDAHLLLEVLLEATPRGRSCSAGLTARPPGTDPAAAMIRADRALYEAKANGRAQVRVAADPTAPDGLAVLPTIVLQPIVTAAALVVVGYEALSRFADNRPPDTVFRVAHANGYGDLLEAHALLAALDEPNRPHGVELYVNASAAALSSARFLDELPRRLDGVVVELTEDDYALDWARHRPAIATLRARGARIAVDDWGSGAGDLAKLVEVRPDVVKLDASLVVGCAGSAARREVLASAIRLARDNGAIVCAEGLENEDDLLTVRAAGVDLVQGYHLGVPGVGWTVTPSSSTAPGTVPDARHPDGVRRAGTGTDTQSHFARTR